MSDHCSIQQQSFHLAMETPSSAAPIAVDQDLSMSRVSRRRCRQRRQQRFVCPSRFLLLALCSIYLASNSFWRSHAFSSPASYHLSSNTRYRGQQQEQQHNEQRTRNSRFYMSSVVETTAGSDSSSRMTDFQRRMKGLVKRNGGAATTNGGRRRAGLGQRANDKPTNLKTVHTLEEYKEALDENKGQIVVVRFFATWCKACKAIQPSYYRMASLYPQIVFLEVPVTNQNSNLHQGLEVPSLPYGHIYVPEAGLVEELKISKKYFANLVKMVRWYDQGECGLDEYVVPAAATDGGEGDK